MGGASQGNLAPDHDPLAAGSGGTAAGAAAGSGGGLPNRPGGADNPAGSGDLPARRTGRSRSASNKIRRRPAAGRDVNLSASDSDQDGAPLV